MTGFGTVETAIEAMKKGAYDYLLKPFKVEEVIHVVERALYRQRLQAENIRLREALTIYKVSEAIALSHDIEHDPRRRAARRDRRGQGRRRDAAPARSAAPARTRSAIKRRRQGRAGHARLPSPAFGVLTEQFAQGVPILAHGGKASRFFTEHAAPAELASFVAVPLQVRGDMVGVLNVFSFTPGKKFDEGHRKMLAVLASRAASAIDNARLVRRPARARTTSLSRANLSLEEMFQQTVAGLRAGARGERPVHARPQRARRGVLARSSRAGSRCPTPRSAASCRPA